MVNVERVLGKVSLCLHFFKRYLYDGNSEELERAQLGVKLEEHWCMALT